MKQERIVMGVCYYPEHWDKSLWYDDLRRMSQAGIQVIRIAEFAWNKFEVKEGVYNFDFFDEFMDLVETTDMKVIFCTPTATPPAWLTEKYPEVLCVDYDGSQHKHGMRRQYNYNSPVYIEKTRQIVEAVVRHYGQRKSIIGWQIDNELNCVTDEFYAQADHIAFREFLKEKYMTLDKVNEAWGTVFWNQTYMDWEEIFLPRHTPRKTANPHLKLDSVRFFSESANRYCKLQADIIKRYIQPDVFITTNGIFKHIDYKKMMTESLDVLSYDSYPTFGIMDQQNPLGDRKWSMNLAKVRSSSQPFAIMEQQAGPGGWVNHHKAPSPKPGQLRLWTFQSIAHGADMVSYFRWRTCAFGTEIYWYGILGHDNQDNRRLEEVTRTAQDVKKIQQVAGGEYQADLAILYDYDNDWDAEYDVWCAPMHQRSQMGWFQALQETHTPFDYLAVDKETTLEELKKYTYLVLPHMVIMKDEIRILIDEYVKQGGTVIAGARTAYKDVYGQCPMKPEPVSMNHIFGVEVEDFTLLKPDQSIQYAKWGEDKIEVNDFHSILKPISKDCQVKATYVGDYYDGKPAITYHTYGQGQAIYVGSSFGAQTAAYILRDLNIAEPYKKQLELPTCCELAIRSCGNVSYLFILNYSGEQQKIQLNGNYQDLLTDKQLEKEVNLEGYGVLVLQVNESIH